METPLLSDETPCWVINPSWVINPLLDDKPPVRCHLLGEKSDFEVVRAEPEDKTPI